MTGNCLHSVKMQMCFNCSQNMLLNDDDNTATVSRLDKGVIVYIADSMGVRDIYEADGEGAISTAEPLAVLVRLHFLWAGECEIQLLALNNFFPGE